ncbi:selenocysteine lyase [Anaeramoeba flamelloides]|uniref:Selenocysteine lyase n=1 Tax=Anaeramoeba flamelloides TaxID=1746091 RepID=A0ABQ8XZ83_9EUKA|nr:selenocysteine lyase [Anaeramoeba flamelloides]
MYNNSIYLDYNATTPLADEVKEAIVSSFKFWRNPGSSYSLFEKMKILQARSNVAKMINTQTNNIIFTSSGTESNSTVIHSVLMKYRSLGKKIHIITSKIDHPSVKLPLINYSEMGLIDLTELPVNKYGFVSPQDLESNIRENTKLVTVMLANNETGVIQPISALSKVIQNYNRNHSKIHFHTDAAQAIGKIPVNVADLGVDSLTVVGHKFYGPRIGALFFKKPEEIIPIFYGGGQERNKRAGTENTNMIVGFGKACELVTKNISKYNKDMKNMRDYLENRLTEIMGSIGVGVVVNKKDPNTPRLPNTASIALVGKLLNAKLVLKHAPNLFASTAAACHSDDVEQRASQVLLDSHVPMELATNTLRISVGRSTTKKDVDMAIDYIKKSVTKLLNDN